LDIHSIVALAFEIGLRQDYPSALIDKSMHLGGDSIKKQGHKPAGPPDILPKIMPSFLLQTAPQAASIAEPSGQLNI
jgi:hypothetical protein